MIRLADETDLDAINQIYNHYVDVSTCTFHLRHESMQRRREWYKARGPEHPVTVFEREGNVVAWASLSTFNGRCAYARTVEVSFYVHHQWHRRGIGRALLSDLIDRARQLGHHVLIGGACTEQEASLRLQESMGFKEVARFREVGWKFDRWLDVAYLQLILDETSG